LTCAAQPAAAGAAFVTVTEWTPVSVNRHRRDPATPGRGVRLPDDRRPALGVQPQVFLEAELHVVPRVASQQPAGAQALEAGRPQQADDFAFGQHVTHRRPPQ
jgi:hypothetical protein